MSDLSETLPPATGTKRIPLWTKLAFTAFMVIQVPFYLYYFGPTIFLFFCDVALFLTLIALWSESSFVASIPTVGILLPQLYWVIDFLGELVGVPMTGLTQYMFRETIPLFARLVSLFHGWLPFVLLWMVYRLGYDRRALLACTTLVWGLMTVCYLFTPAPPAPENNPNLPVNINFVYGMSGTKAQTWMPGHLYFALWMMALPICLFVPTHFLLRKIFRPSTSPHPSKKQSI